MQPEASVPQIVEVETIKVAVTIPKELDRAIEVEAARRGITKSRIFSEGMAAFVGFTLES